MARQPGVTRCPPRRGDSGRGWPSLRGADGCGLGVGVVLVSRLVVSVSGPAAGGGQMWVRHCSRCQPLPSGSILWVFSDRPGQPLEPNVCMPGRPFWNVSQQSCCLREPLGGPFLSWPLGRRR